ncbi:MAG: hypothetical protein ACO4AJ_00360 [Prochlorothrix sp.]
MSNSTNALQPLQNILQNLSGLTGLPFEDLEEQAKDLDFPFFEFQGQVLVSPEAIDPLIDQWADSIKAQLQSASPAASPTGKATKGRGGQKPAATGRSATKGTASKGTASKSAASKAAASKGTASKGTASKSAASNSTASKVTAGKKTTGKKPGGKSAASKAGETKTGAKAGTKSTAKKAPPKGGGRGKGRTKAVRTPKSPGIPNPTPAASLKASLGGAQLPLPPGFADMVSTRYDSTLNKVLPSNADERQRFLAEITQETQEGQNFLNQLAVTLERKYKGRVSQQRAYEKLLAAATTLAA